MNFKNRQQLLALVAIGAVAYFAADKLLFSPLWRSWNDRKAQIAELRKKINQGGLLLQREQGIRRRWDEMNKNTLPNDVSVAEQRLLQAFDYWARESRVSVTSITPQKREADDYTSLECRVDAFGSLATVTRFLYNIEKDPMGLKLESVEMNARDNEGQQISLGLQISGLILNSRAQ
ncbi:MAG: hypothetical protein HZA90_26120 [Verrucomicrobia bacterium]|nr:hypothetical protein [Verrucomicrobiota bacterium]